MDALSCAFYSLMTAVSKGKERKGKGKNIYTFTCETVGSRFQDLATLYQILRLYFTEIGKVQKIISGNLFLANGGNLNLSNYYPPFLIPAKNQVKTEKNM